MASCDTCRKPYGVEPFLQVEGKMMCNSCFRLNYSCPGCGQQIAGSYVPDGPRKWHPACHQAAFPPVKGCAECRKPFTANELAYEVNGKQLCYSCSQFAVNFACAGCGQVIKDAYIPLENLKYHTACFNKLQSNLLCANCRVPFGENPYVEIDGKCLCDRCWQKLYSCAKCGGKLTGALVESDGLNYHPECATIPLCGGCNQPIVAGEYILLEGRKWHPGCKHIYLQNRTVGRVFGVQGGPERKCAHCSQGIIGEYVIINGKDYHPECFGTGQRHHKLPGRPAPR
eukprot:TRINITY_DN15017_c0_g1_i1.p1 TRINITY_DN15017_c0_g1~~TRINITY_DN15017_c0_g1_i1.p1  ORF type:complete len:285 (+),score=28.63 TRINITY_DN15017_c0_g1_i1:402-1256(+)